MRFRLRLALVFLLLSALPLALLAVYSFSRSSAALKRAIEAEAQLTAKELDERVGAVSVDVDRRVRALARLPVSFWLRTGGGEPPDVDPKIVDNFSQALPFIRNFRFVPATAGGGGQAQTVWTFRAGSDAAAGKRPPAARGGEPEPDVEAMLRRASASAGAALASLPSNLPPEERDKVVAELDRVRAEIGRTLALRREAPPAPPAPPAPAPARARVAPVATAAAPVAEVAPAPKVVVGGDLSCAVRADGEVVGQLTGQLNAREIFQSVLGQTHREQGEIPFALDGDGELYAAGDGDRERLEKLPAVAALRGGPAAATRGADREWIVVSHRDEASGLRFGIARPISRAMRDLKTETALNFVAAFFLIGLATVGMIPLTGGLVRNVRALEHGAERIAAGDLTTRVPVTSRDEFGRLAASFNRMAADLSEHQEKLLEQERIGKEREIERRLLAAENERKSAELEEARRFQLSLLPRELPARPGFELAVAMSTATEVGGDYYDFRSSGGAGEGDGTLDLAIGDATGHGAAAGTMVTVAKSLFTAATADERPAAFLGRATGLVHGLGLSRMAMALTVARLDGRRLTIASAGMPPALHFRAASGTVEEVALPGMPLGARAVFDYAERAIELAPGDAVLFTSDGFPELADARGEVLGYERARALFAGAARRPAREIVAELERATGEWTGERAPTDDITFLVLRAG